MHAHAGLALSETPANGGTRYGGALEAVNSPKALGNCDGVDAPLQWRMTLTCPYASRICTRARHCPEAEACLFLASERQALLDPASTFFLSVHHPNEACSNCRRTSSRINAAVAYGNLNRRHG